MITNGILIIVGLIALLNLMAPLLIWKTQSIPARVSLEPIEDPGFLVERGERFQELDSRLREMGADYIGSSTLALEAVTTYFSIYLLDDGLSIATLVTIIAADDTEVVYTEFSRLYQDGSILDVNNSPVISAYPDMDLKIMARVPEIAEPAALFAVFTRLAESLHNTSPVANAGNLDCFQVVREYIEKESDELVRLGYCQPAVDDSGNRRLTLKGAYLMSWGQLIPGSWIKKSRDARYARKLLQAA